jgi:YHS domain-containing protein
MQYEGHVQPAMRKSASARANERCIFTTYITVAESILKEEELMERDVVCGMQVDPNKAAGKSEYNGKTYYFCSSGCKTKFDANPAQYAK